MAVTEEVGLSGIATHQADLTSDLVVRAQSGDRDALDALVRMHTADVERITTAIVRDADDAADLTQEVWIRVADKIGQLSDPSRFRAWLRRIARNVSLNFLRRADSSADRLDLLDAIDPITTEQNGGWRSTPEGRAMIRDDQRKVWETLGSLNDDDREVLRLREIDDLDYAAIASALGTTAHAAEVRSSRARARFRKRFAVIEDALAWCRENPLRLVSFADREGMRDHGIAHAVACATCRERVKAMKLGRGVLSAFGALLLLRDRVSELLHGGRVAAVQHADAFVSESAPHFAAQLPRFVAAAPLVTSVGTVAATVVLGAAAVNVDAAFENVEPASPVVAAHVVTLSQVATEGAAAPFAISGERVEETSLNTQQSATTSEPSGHRAPAPLDNAAPTSSPYAVPSAAPTAPTSPSAPAPFAFSAPSPLPTPAPLASPSVPAPSAPAPSAPAATNGDVTTGQPAASTQQDTSAQPSANDNGHGHAGDTHGVAASDASNGSPNAHPNGSGAAHGAAVSAVANASSSNGHADAPPAGSKSNSAQSGNRPAQASSASQDPTPQGQAKGQAADHDTKAPADPQPGAPAAHPAPSGQSDAHGQTPPAPPAVVETVVATTAKQEPAGLAHRPVDSGREVAATNKPRTEPPVAMAEKPKPVPAPKKASA